MSDSKPASHRGLLALVCAAAVLITGILIPAILGWNNTEAGEGLFIRVRKTVTLRHEGIGEKLVPFILGKSTVEDATFLLGAPDRRETADGLDLWTYEELRLEERKHYILGFIPTKREGKSRKSIFHLLAFRAGVLVYLLPQGSLDAETARTVNRIRR